MFFQKSRWVMLMCLIFYNTPCLAGYALKPVMVGANLGMLGVLGNPEVTYKINPLSSAVLVDDDYDNMAVDMVNNGVNGLLTLQLGYTFVESGFGVNASFQYNTIDLSGSGHYTPEVLGSSIFALLLNADWHVMGAKNIGAYFLMGAGVARYTNVNGSYVISGVYDDSSGSNVLYSATGTFSGYEEFVGVAQAKIGGEFSVNDGTIFNINLGLMFVSEAKELNDGISTIVATGASGAVDVPLFATDRAPVVLGAMFLTFLEARMVYMFDY